VGFLAWKPYNSIDLYIVTSEFLRLTYSRSVKVYWNFFNDALIPVLHISDLDVVVSYENRGPLKMSRSGIVIQSHLYLAGNQCMIRLPASSHLSFIFLQLSRHSSSIHNSPTRPTQLALAIKYSLASKRTYIQTYYLLHALLLYTVGHLILYLAAALIGKSHMLSPPLVLFVQRYRG